jgi:glycosyltransferase involved in cell wall biosynthesis
MRFSLIITSRHKPIELNRFLFSVLKQKDIDINDIEIIFVDQGNNKEIINDFNKKLNIIYLKIDEVSLSKARNYGFKYAKGDIIGFPDDDCWYDKNYLVEVHNYFMENRNVAMWISNVKDPIKNLLYGKRPE